jgi:mono/diheme cytochrome c family protein
MITKNSDRHSFINRGTQIVAAAGILWALGVGAAVVLHAAALPAQEGAAGASAAQTVSAGVYTEDQAKRGEKSANVCISCHGGDLSGGDVGPPLTGPDFLSNWDGLTLADLFDKIRTSMPADAPGSLRPPAVADIISFIAKRNGWPAGDKELPSDKAALGQIKIQKQ